MEYPLARGGDRSPLHQLNCHFQQGVSLPARGELSLRRMRRADLVLSLDTEKQYDSQYGLF